MRYCAGCVSLDEVLCLGDDVKTCPSCKKTTLTEAEVKALRARIEAEVAAQLPRGAVERGVTA